MISRRAAAFWVIAALIGASALAFGSVEPWASSLLRLGALLAFALVAWSESPRELLRGSPGAVILPAALLVVWGFLQSVPLPSAVTASLSPRTARVQREILPPDGGAELPGFLLGRAPSQHVTIEPGAATPRGPDDAGSRSAKSSLSIDPHATRMACLAWITPLLLVVASERLARSAPTRYRMLWAVAIWTGVLGAIAVIQRVTGSDSLLWIRPVPANSMPLGPFINPNHFAGFVELGILVVVGLALALLAEPGGRLTLESVRSAIVDRAWALPRLLSLGAIAVVGTCGIVLSASRGAAMALFVGVCVLLPWRRARTFVPVAAVLLLVGGLAVGVAAWLGREESTLQTAFFAQGQRDPSLALRSDVWGRTCRIILDHPWTGTGLGTFAHAYASYDREGEWLGTSQAHNDYLQLASESGLVGMLLVGWLVLAVARRVLWPALRPGSSRPRWTTAALASAILAMLLHSILEFNLQVPAVAALFAVLGGMLIAAAGERDARPEATESA